ncbi:MAG: hypothetical protein A2Z47_09745 [Thermodesulfovibrio sp. RBG_19FT_COMBO_42_12]|nr:MAG: hypothetical protein A2Z47_09745 [Thermodesulfovibrio sp. RBG_19FT_COMBO_42_12]
MNIKSTINPNPKMQLTAGTVIMGWDGLPNERIWDVRNRIVGINGFTLTSNLTCNPVVASFKYDALGRRRRRIEKTINGRTIQYLHDGLDIVQEIENGIPSVNYVRTLNIDEPLVRIPPGALRFYQTDALGSVIALTDETGTVKTTYSYDPFGNVTISGEPSDNPFQYTGRENDGTGLYYYRARYYSSELQRFISEDPIGLRGGINKFAYVENKPVNRTDPLGTMAIVVPGTHYCGFGADRPLEIPSNDCVDEACRQHDICYKNAVTFYPPNPPFSEERRKCDRKLCQDILKCKDKTCLRIGIATVFYCSFLGK